MAIRDLKLRYDKKDSRQAVNAAIRAEMVGGDDLLDALGMVHRLAWRLKQKDLAGQREACEALTALTELRNLMAKIVIEREPIVPPPHQEATYPSQS